MSCIIIFPQIILSINWGLMNYNNTMIVSSGGLSLVNVGGAKLKEENFGGAN
jgi:hypothetical protein